MINVSHNTRRVTAIVLHTGTERLHLFAETSILRSYDETGLLHKHE